MNRRLVVLLGLMAATACANKAVTSTMPDAAAPAESAAGMSDSLDMMSEPEAEPSGTDELAQLETQLAGGEAALVGAGVELDTTLAQPAAREDGFAFQASGEAQTRCERICSIAEAVCDLETRICDLGGRHPGEARYEAACKRARSDCERATAACDGCSEA